MRCFAAFALLAACGSPGAEMTPDAPAVTPDSAVDSPAAAEGFGDLSGMCGVLGASDLTGATPELIRATMTFARRYNDPADRPLLTEGGQHLAETPNAGGSSGLSEIFAYEELARCEHAMLLKTETEISYDTAGKITDLEVMMGAQKIGVSVTRAQTYPLGMPYPVDTATMLITRKLNDIKMSTANVSAADRWTKQVLAVLAYDSATADVVAQVWSSLAADEKADTIVVVTTTDGDDTFIYTNQ
jgi:hypothetical protein